MRFLVLSEIHGNIYAFDAVLRDAERNGFDSVIFLGDTVINGLYPRECFEKLFDLGPGMWVKGNTDALFTETERSGTPSTEEEKQIASIVSFARERLPKDYITQLSSTHEHVSFLGEDTSIYCCHGSPLSFTDEITPEMCEVEILEKIKSVEDKILLCAHTHQSMVTFIDSRYILNPGGIGYSFDGDNRASYGLLTIERASIDFKIHKVEYKSDSYIRDIQDKHPPFAEKLISMVRYARPI
jgi:putative phosphoesterase